MYVEFPYCSRRYKKPMVHLTDDDDREAIDNALKFDDDTRARMDC